MDENKFRIDSAAGAAAGRLRPVQMEKPIWGEDLVQGGPDSHFLGNIKWIWNETSENTDTHNLSRQEHLRTWIW